MEAASRDPPPNPEPERAAKLHGSACDTCRRRRVKCDGNQPCNRCRKSQVACTYGSLASRASAVSYARHLEQKIVELRGLLRQQTALESDSSTDDPAQSEEDVRGRVVDMLVGPGDDYVYRLPGTEANVFYGRFSGLSVIQSLGINSARLTQSPILKRFSRELIQAFEVLSLTPRSTMSMRALAVLPPKNVVLSLSEHALETALICHECLDRQSYARHIDQLYEMDPENYAPRDRSFVALVYAMVALGKRFSLTTEAEEIDESAALVRFKGLAYFHASCDLLDITEANDLNAIRAVICQVRYLCSMSMISKAYSTICTGVAVALRMGLHVAGPAIIGAFSPQERFERRKVFATLNMMEIYLSTLLGLPLILKGADRSQMLGLQDPDLQDEGNSIIIHDRQSPISQTALCQKVNLILAGIGNARARIAHDQLSIVDAHYEEDASEIAEREVEIRDWFALLPALPPEFSDIIYLRADLTLRVWHSMAQIVLYRQFLHHLSHGPEQPGFDIIGYEYGSKCVQAATQGILTVELFQTCGILHEGFWSCVYMLELSVSILLYFVSASPHATTIEASKQAGRKAQRILANLSKYNLSARKCYNSLTAVLEASQVASEQD